MDKPNSKKRAQQVPVNSNLEALRDILYELNCEVRTPMTGIIELANLLIDEDKAEVEVHSNDLKVIKETAESIIDIIDEVLTNTDNVEDKKEVNERALLL